jgi:zinc protease
MMKMNICIGMLLLTCLNFIYAAVPASKTDGYVVAISSALQTESDWMEVVKALEKKHKAEVVVYQEQPEELLEELRRLQPRYLVFVAKPESLNRSFVMKGHRLSRRIDEDIFADYMWGIITGYTASDAMQMVERSRKPYLVRTALNTTSEMSDGKWFDRFAFLNDGGTPGGWGEKRMGDQQTRHERINQWELLGKWVEKYKELDPDLLVTSSHATEKNLEMPFSLGNLKPRDGRLYADFVTPEFLEGTLHPRVYFAAGNCLIGNIANDPQSMAVAWLSGMDATSMVGYVVTTWYGRNGWGGLKYWAANAGRLTLAQAIYLNQQEMLQIEYNWHPDMLKINYPFSNNEFGERDVLEHDFQQLIGKKPTQDQIGFIHDRDVVAFYGDPAWDVKLQKGADDGYHIDFRIKRNKCLITITTNEHFNTDRVKGGKLKQQHVADIPMAYYFPKRLRSPRLADGQSWDIVLAEDFFLLYNCDFEKNKTYTIELDID